MALGRPQVAHSLSGQHGDPDDTCRGAQNASFVRSRPFSGTRPDCYAKPMSHLHRFFQPELRPESGTELFLPEDEAHHALSVARLRDGEQVAVFAGRGTEATGPIFRQGKRQARVLIEQLRREAPPDAHVILAPAWLQKEKPLDEIVRRGTELGVSRFAFWRAQRSQRPVAAHDKWHRLAVESCKQSGRLHLPQFDFFEDLPSAMSSFDGCVLVADILTVTSDLPLPPSALKSCALIIGPEGDFTDGEREALRAGRAIPVSLGRQVLRTEAASVAMATLVLGALGELGTRLSLSGEAES